MRWGLGTHGIGNMCENLNACVLVTVAIIIITSLSSLPVRMRTCVTDTHCQVARPIRVAYYRSKHISLYPVQCAYSYSWH